MTVSWNSAGKAQAAAILPPIAALPAERSLRLSGLAYLLVALGVIAAVIAGEVRAASEDIRLRLHLHEAAYRAPLATALASSRLANVKTIVADMAAAPFIAGIAIQDHDTGVVLTGRGIIVDEDGRATQVDGSPATALAAWGLFSHSFLLETHRDGTPPARVRATLYSDGTAVLDRLGARAATIVTALTIETAALWLLFLFLTRRMVSQPLARLTAQVDDPDLDDRTDKVFGRGKVSALEDAVIEMRRRIKFEFRSLVENSVDGMAVVQDGRFRFANRALAELLGYGHPETLARLPSVATTVPEAARKRVDRLLARIESRLETWPNGRSRLDFPLSRGNGETVWVEASFQRVVWRGRPGLLVSLTDITRHKRQRDQLLRLAIYDSLTGAVNRRRFMDCAAREIDRARRYQHPLAVLALDIDHFKVINDTHGHSVGDIVLKRMTEKVAATLRECDVLGRIGGEEFAVLLPDTTLEGATILAERVRRTVEGMDILVGPLHVPVSVSVGVADGLGLHHETFADGLKRADDALYRAKELGRNRIEIAAPPPPEYAGGDI